MSTGNTILQITILGGAIIIAFVIGWAVGIGELERIKLQVVGLQNQSHRP